MIKDCPIRKKKLAAKKPGQKHPFGCSTRQENIGNDGSPAKESNKGEAKEENTEEAKEDLHFGERDEWMLHSPLPSEWTLRLQTLIHVKSQTI